MFKKALKAFSIICVFASAMSFAQTSDGSISISTISLETSKPRLTRAFVVTGLETTTALRDWQRHLELTVRNGYPPSEFWIGEDESRAANALRLASIAASNDADWAALRELKASFEAVRLWSNTMLQAHHDLRLANYYMSNSAFANDPEYQRASYCTEAMSTMLGHGYQADIPSCH